VTTFKRLGRALRFLREQQGRSQKEVAVAAQVTPPMLSAFENERARPELDTLDRLLHRGLKVSLAELEWALDIVNDRLPRDGSAAPRKGAAGTAAARSSARPGLRSSGAPASGSPIGEALAELTEIHSTALSPALEQGYAEVARGLLRISRAVFESVVESAAEPPGSDLDD
jgi:transcriptional regulator with XRE-family HTH domain